MGRQTCGREHMATEVPNMTDCQTKEGSEGVTQPANRGPGSQKRGGAWHVGAPPPLIRFIKLKWMFREYFGDLIFSLPDIQWWVLINRRSHCVCWHSCRLLSVQTIQPCFVHCRPCPQTLLLRWELGRCSFRLPGLCLFHSVLPDPFELFQVQQYSNMELRGSLPSNRQPVGSLCGGGRFYVTLMVECRAFSQSVSWGWCLCREQQSL